MSDVAGTAGDQDLGLPGPAPSIPPRAPRSVRRTSTVDIAHAGINGADAGLVLAGRARDLFSGADGAATVRRIAWLSAGVGSDGVVTALRAFPDGARAEALVGRAARAGFRTAVLAAVPEHVTSASPLHQLLEEVPIAVLLSGFTASSPISPSRARSDVCAGWRAEGPAMQTLLRTGRAPLEPSHAAPSLDVPGDRFAWHTVPRQPVGTMRRRRLLDVLPGPLPTAYSMFRDTFTDDAGNERVLHEYSLTASFDDTFRLLRVSASPRALPFAQCPSAAMSATRLLGRRATELSDVIDRDLWGPTSCTHLNDLLRVLAAVPELARLASP